ncbi:MAG: hypothetical protein ACPL1D_00695 [Microgenomates group bacterium]
MSKKNKFLIILKELTKILNQKDDYKKKYNEIRLMKFKIQSHFGNLELLKKKKKELIDALWFLGKLEEVIDKYNPKISIDELQKILDYVEKIRGTDLGETEKSSPKETGEENKVLAMDIYQDSQGKKIIN